MGKHPDFMVAHPTPTIFRPLVEIFEISYFLREKFRKGLNQNIDQIPTFVRNRQVIEIFREKGLHLDHELFRLLTVGNEGIL